LIAVVNFVAIWWKKTASQRVTLFIIGIQWLFVTLSVVVGLAVHNHRGDYYMTPTPVMT
jgi:hypothetical protein